MTGIPMLLNTSFNDREPICESPEHAITCFQNTSVDALYFADYGRLVTRRSK
jgi:carbamoyltransferase